MHFASHAQTTVSLLRTLCAALLMVGACSAEPLDDELDVEEAPETLAVVGGVTAASCAWPSTVDVNGCTGTLIHPRVVTTAAHCLRGASGKVTFTAGKGVAGAFSLTGRCRAGASGATGGSTSRDWGYCVLPEDPRVAAMPYTPPLVGCEAEKFLKAGASAWVVGFGTTGRAGQGLGVKRQVQVKINRVASGILNIGDARVGACHGDSGGPLYMKVGDATHDWGWRVIGSTSGASSARCDCTCATIYVNIDQHVKAIEANEKIDVTPCTDADGKWAPSTQCRDFPGAPELGTGTYPMCRIEKAKGPIETCGANPLGAPGASTPSPSEAATDRNRQ